MLQLPNVVGLVLCEQVVTDANTRNVTLVKEFVPWPILRKLLSPKRIRSNSIA
jgi:hypothetical protein